MFTQLSRISLLYNRHRITWLVVAITSSAALIASYSVLVHTAKGQHLDHQVFQQATNIDSEEKTWFVFHLNWISNQILWFSFFALILIYAAITRNWKRSIVAAITAPLAALSSHYLRTLIFTRPRIDPSIPWYHNNSFPSGHASAALGLALGIAILLPPLIRVLAAIPLAFWLAIIDYDLMQQGWHRLSDVVGANAFTLAVFSVLAFLFTPFQPEGSRSVEFHNLHQKYAKYTLMTGLSILIISILSCFIAINATRAPLTHLILIIATLSILSLILPIALSVWLEKPTPENKLAHSQTCRESTPMSE